MVSITKISGYIRKAQKQLYETTGFSRKFLLFLSWIPIGLHLFVHGILLRYNRRTDRLYEKYLHEPRIAHTFFARYFSSGYTFEGLHLDAGCGRGRIPAMVSNIGGNIIGFDIHENQFWKKTGTQNFCIADIQYIPFKDSVFTACTTFLVLEYIPNDKTALREIFRVLKPNSHLLVQVTNKENLKQVYTKQKLDKYHIREYTIEEISQCVRSVGFTIEKVQTEGFYAPVFTMTINTLIWVLGWESIENIIPERNRGIIFLSCMKPCYD